MIIRTIFASKKQIRKWDDDKDTMAYCTYSSQSGEYQIVLPYKVSTRTRLHELGHVLLQHPKENIEYTDQYIRREIEAELWACTICGKQLSIDSLLNIAAQVLEWKEKPNYIFTSTLKVLDRCGCTLNKSRRSNLWNGIRELESFGKDL